MADVVGVAAALRAAGAAVTHGTHAISDAKAK
jgi:hypothetical protein